MTEFSGFRDLADEMQKLADYYRSRKGSAQGRDPDTGQFASPKPRIRKGIDRAMEEVVVPQARTDAEESVPAYSAMTIDHESLEWKDEVYRHRYYATDDLVRYHEFGTSTKANDKSKATISTFPNGQRGYRIPSEGKAAIPAEEWDGPPEMVYRDGDGKDAVIFDYVVHPGVAEQRFMRDALDHNSLTIEEYIANELDKIGVNLR